jgi:hypothetical protein
LFRINLDSNKKNIGQQLTRIDIIINYTTNVFVGILLFSSSHYSCCCANEEGQDMSWLDYSKELDKKFVFVVSCLLEIIKSSHLKKKKGSKIELILGLGLKHEPSGVHCTHDFYKWIHWLINHIFLKIAIDKHLQELIRKEHWKSILVRVISIVWYLVEQNLVFFVN